VWPVGRESHRRLTGEVAVRTGGLRANSVPRTTDTLRQTATEAAVTAYRVGAGHRATVLCAIGRQDSD